MKKLLVAFCLLMLTLCLTSCTYNPPEGWSKRPHTYKEILAFAKSMDPNATVSKKYADIEDEYNWPYREWEAVINGVNCHVASVSGRVWNEGIWAREFAEFYYRIETDYDYAVVIQNKLVDNYPEWKCEETVHERYQFKRIFFRLEMPEFRMLEDDEFEQVWQTACEISEDYEKLAIESKIEFTIPIPVKYCTGTGESFLQSGYRDFSDLTEESKKAFLQDYKERWALLESGLPLRY